MIRLSLKVEQRSIQDLRDRLLSDTRGMVGAFKLALGEAVHYWQRNFAKEHFEETAYTRYSGIATRAKYASMRPVDPSSVVGTINRKWEVIFMQRTGLREASLKMRKQFWKRLHMNNKPLMFTGELRSQILDINNFKVKGSSKSIRGSWTGTVKWRAMNAHTWSQPSRTLGDTIVYATPEEYDELAAKVENDFFPVYASLANARGGLPSLADLPLLT